MSRQRKKRRGRSTSPFVMLHCHLLDSQGWHELSPHARLAYLELCRLYNGENNGRISMSARRLARRMPCDKSTASRALRELDDAGFIEAQRLGTFTRKNRLASEYRLTNFTCDVTNDLPGRKWNCLRWNPSDGTTKPYRTGAQTRQRKAETPSTVQSNRTVSPKTAPSTVRADRTHLESAMGGRPNGHAGQTRSGQTDLDAGLTVAVHEGPLQTSSNPDASSAPVPEFPDLPDFLRRVRLGTSCTSTPVEKEKSK